MWIQKYQNDMANIHNYIKEADGDKLKMEIQSNPSAVNLTDERGFPAIVLASYGGNIDITKILIEADADIDMIDVAGNTALMGVVFKGNTDIVRLLLDAGANVNSTNKTGASPLTYAVMFDQLEIAKLLIENGANISHKDEKGKSILAIAKEKENQNMIELLSIDIQ